MEYEADEHSILDDLILKMSDKELHNVIEKELMKLPMLKRTIMDLYLLEHMTYQKIATIKGIPISEVEKIIIEVSAYLKKSLSSLV